MVWAAWADSTLEAQTLEELASEFLEVQTLGVLDPIHCLEGRRKALEGRRKAWADHRKAWAAHN